MPAHLQKFSQVSKPADLVDIISRTMEWQDLKRYTLQVSTNSS